MYGPTCGKCGARRVDRQIGLESAFDCLAWATGAEPDGCWVCRLVAVFREVRRVLRPDGVCWIECGTSYSSGGRATYRSGVSDNKGHQVQDGMPRPDTPSGLKPKDLLLQPFHLAMALQHDGWWLRQVCVWDHVNPMPESVTDRPSTQHSYVLMLTKSARYYYDSEAVRVPSSVKPEYAARYNSTKSNGQKWVEQDGQGKTDFASGAGKHWESTRSLRSVWGVPSEPSSERHFALFPSGLVKPMVLSSTSEKGACPSCGSPWRRVTEKERRPNRDNCNTQYNGHRGVSGGVGNDAPRVVAYAWQPTCECINAGDPVPCVCLDPFSGLGTTGLVALSYGRRYIGIELSETYAARSRERLAAVAAQERIEIAEPVRNPAPAQERMGI
jgi:DNA modification methylase